MDADTTESPRTLRDVAGMGAAAPSLREAALVLIDCQETYRRGVMALEGVEPALAEVGRLLERARAAGAPVFHVRHDAGPGSPYDVAAPSGQISAEVAPRDGEPVITKRSPDSFAGTDLEARLRAAGRTDVVLAGFMTHMCVSSTARGAFSLGFRPTVVAAATATRALPDGAGGAVPAAAVQVASLAGLADLVAVVVPAAAALPD